jgi:hypothetical protein
MNPAPCEGGGRRNRCVSYQHRTPSGVVSRPLAVGPLLAAAAAGHGSETPPWAVYAALVTAGVGLIGQALIRMKEARDRRRDEYSRAFEAAMAWTEFPYRIARRLSNEADAVGPIVARMHDAQEQICFHENWLRSVSDDIAKNL